MQCEECKKLTGGYCYKHINKMTTCQHFFMKISEISKPKPGAVGIQFGIPGIEAGCIYCGEIRKMWVDGIVTTVVSKTLKPTNAETNTGR